MWLWLMFSFSANVCIISEEEEHNEKRQSERESIGRISIHTNQAEKNILTAGEHIKPNKNREKESTRIFFSFSTQKKLW
jgi:hypothetical protein